MVDQHQEQLEQESRERTKRAREEQEVYANFLFEFPPHTLKGTQKLRIGFFQTKRRVRETFDCQI
jgi:hypothetical protein